MNIILIIITIFTIQLHAASPLQRMIQKTEHKLECLKCERCKIRNLNFSELHKNLLSNKDKDKTNQMNQLKEYKEDLCECHQDKEMIES